MAINVSSDDGDDKGGGDDYAGPCIHVGSRKEQDRRGPGTHGSCSLVCERHTIKA